MLNRLFGRQPTPPEEPSVDYADLFNQIMDGLAAGWSADQLKACLVGRENDQKFVEWLYDYGKREQIEQSVAERLVQWGEIERGAVAQMAQDIGGRVLNSSVSAPDNQTISSQAAYSLSPQEQQAQTLIEHAIQQFSDQDYAGATESVQKAIQVAPEYYPAWQSLGELMSALQEHSQAVDAYNKALAIKPDLHEALLEKGISLGNLSRCEEAINAFDAALEIKPNLHDALFNKGIALAYLGRYEAAIDAYDAALKIEPNLYKSIFNKGNSLLNLGRHEAAIDAYDAALKIKPDLHGGLYNKGNSLLNLGRHEAAIDAYDAALKIEPNLDDALSNKGLALNHLGRHEAAIDAYDAALEIKPHKYEALIGKGNSLAKLNSHKEAIAAYDSALKIKPDLHGGLYNKGNSLLNLGRHEAAIDAYDAALKIEPNLDDALYSKGLSLAYLGHHKEAIDCYDKALEIEPNLYEALYNKSISLAHLGYHEAAIDCCDKALTIRPDEYQALNFKGLSLHALGRYEDAITVYDAALIIKPSAHYSWVNKATTTCKLKKYYPIPKNLNFYLKNQFSPETQTIEPHIAALKDSLNFLTQDSIDWGYLHSFLGYAYLKHSKQLQNPVPYWKEARRSYQIAAKILTSIKFPEEHLEILQSLVRVELAFENVPEARDYQNQGRKLFEKLRSQKPDNLKPAFERKFASFVQLEIDLCIGENNPIAALEQAEFYKNRCLTWILDTWTDTPQSPNFQHIQTLLKPQTALIYWHLSHESLTTFVLLPHQEIPKVLTTNRTKQAQQLMTWLGTYTSEYRGYASKKAGSEQRPKHPWRLHLKSLLEQLKKILKIEAICNELPETISELILVPHRNLHCLPLHTLFPDNLTSTYLPSAQIGLNLQTKRNTLVPLLNIDDPAIDQPSMVYTRMVYARIESEVVRQLVGHASYLGGHVTTTAAHQALEEKYHTLHFTGHGEYNHRQPENSALQLSDGTLTSQHISTLDLSSYNLVCLASCETALTGTQKIATEYVGLVSAFLKAGASNVLSTLWQIEEIESTWFIVRFYQALMDNQSPATALKTAQHWLRNVTPNKLNAWLEELLAFPGLSQGTIDQLKTDAELISEKHSDSLNEPLYIDPFFWAGFTLTGRG